MMLNKFIKWLGREQAGCWYVYTPDGYEGYYIESLTDECYVHDKKHYGEVAIKVGV